jgi:DNA-binding MarR family transcriptional regulator
MVRRVPDVTRLLDRLEEAELIARARGDEDRRYVTTRITAKGLEELARLDSTIESFLEAHLGHVRSDQLQALTDLLSLLRQRR